MNGTRTAIASCLPRSAAAIVLALGLSSCGGSDALIGGTLSGLGDGLSVVLQNNNTDNLSLTMNGNFTFPTGIANGTTYSVTVLTQPTGQTCNVSNGAGTVDTDKGDPSGIQVTCSATSSLGGTLTGMLAGRSITLANGVQLVTVAQNGPFAFAGVLPAGSTYAVTIVTQPAGQICSVINGTGTVVANVMSTVAVTCL
ncbi:MAG TPA: hypothetical protein PKC97_18905 [Burkholderiaceae bacterium]|jgi:hypothetical protein|nr:hypothetical protein [Burkholderiaceae bacterium]